MPEPAAATRLLAEFAVDTRFEQLPSDLVNRLRTDALDGVAVGVLGSTFPWITTATTYWEELGGKEEATVWGRRSKLPVIAATLANSHAQNAFEFDDTYIWGDLGTHQGNNVVPAAFAVAEMLGGVRGRDFVEALAVGHEVGVRVIKACVGAPAGHNYTAITSTFGAAATAGRLLGLNADEMTWALGSAGSYVGGLLTIPPSSMVKRMVNGRAAQGGVIGALLAKRGFTGIENVLEAGQGGFFSTLGIRPDWDALLGGLGVEWYSRHLHTKRFPMCTWIHASLEAACQLVREQAIAAADIDRVAVRTTTRAQLNTVGFWPDTIASAQMSLAFGVACALVYGEVGPATITMDNVRNPVIERLMRRIDPVADPDLDGVWKGKGGPSRVEVHLADGRILESPMIGEATQMTDSEIESKAADAMTPVLGEAHAATLIDMFRRLDTLDDVRPIFGLLSAP